MHYFAILNIGQNYIVGGKRFVPGEEVPITYEEYEYLKLQGENIIEDQGNHQVLKGVPRFKFRTEELTETEKVLAEVADVDDSLAPRKPGRPSKAS